ncbi:MAG: (2Fe-2S)-binding protein [Nitrosopumilales archaeon]|nr:MAG: (2Fe-2S)-binding protein [Nitrosopumilales archaeon]KAG2478407.1 MAG: (2Fe-2S)-binding protein [Nitrosopumilales archaeon]
MSEQDQSSKGLSRRDFLKLMGAAGTALAFAPFIPWGNFMPNPSSATLEKVKVILPDGTHASVNTFPTNHAEIITYPKTKDEVLNEEAFRKWQLIRLPEELGGAKKDVSAFRVYSMICLHLWCLWKYWPQEGRKRGECPCHGSMYDPTTGTAFAGPASVQAPPSNTLPNLDLEADLNGFLWILPPNFGVNANGVVGYGRFVK